MVYGHCKISNIWNYKAALKWANLMFRRVIIRHCSFCWLVRALLSSLFAVLRKFTSVENAFRHLEFLTTVLSSSHCYGVYWICQSNNNFIEMVNETTALALSMRYQIVQSQICKRKFYIYTVAKSLVNLKYSLVLLGPFRFKPANQYVERCDIFINCGSNMKDLISKIYLNSISSKEIFNKFQCTIY
jgi:hypothetical protein